MTRALLLALLVCGCVADPDAGVAVECPSRAEFDAVSPLLEERCGTLDCHGSLSRPLRVYGALGMRLFADPHTFDPDTSAYPDASPTSDDERDATRRSLCALEPEALSVVMQENGDAGDLTVLRKATGDEQHKGGVLFHDGDGAERCLVSWLEGTTDAPACAAALDPR